MADEEVVETPSPEEPEFTEPERPDGQGPTEYEKKLRAEVAKYRREATDYKKRMSELLTKEEEAKRAALAEQGKFKELYEAESKKWSEDLTELKAFRERDQGRREKLLEDIPEEKRELYAAIPTDALEDIVITLKGGKPSPTRGERPAGGPEGKSYAEMTNAERIELKEKNRALYVKQYTDYYIKKNGMAPPFIP